MLVFTDEFKQFLKLLKIAVYGDLNMLGIILTHDKQFQVLSLHEVQFAEHVQLYQLLWHF